MDQDYQEFSPGGESEQAPEEGKPSKARAFLSDFIETILLAAVLFLAINFTTARIRVDGSSMVPTLKNGEFVFVNRLAYKLGEIEHGDVIVFDRFAGQEEYIKRVIGLPGDRVRVYNGLVFLNDRELNEPYIAAAPNYSGKWEVPEGQVFVLGDNRNSSEDSHNWGPVQIKNIIGKAIFVYWPSTDWGTIAARGTVSVATYP